MFLIRMWGDIWYVGDGTDVLVAIVVNVLLFMFMVALTIAVMLPVLAFMLLRWGWNQFPPDSVPTIANQSSALYSSRPSPCGHCGNTTSRDITRCIRCGH